MLLAGQKYFTHLLHFLTFEVILSIYYETVTLEW